VGFKRKRKKRHDESCLQQMLTPGSFSLYQYHRSFQGTTFTNLHQCRVRIYSSPSSCKAIIMGANISTMGSMVPHFEGGISRQTMAGLILVAPLFISYFMTIRDHYANRMFTMLEENQVFSSLCVYQDNDDLTTPLLGMPVSPSETSTGEMSLDRLEPVPQAVATSSSSTKYLEAVSARLMQMSTTVAHSEKIAISAALYQLGEILFNNGQFNESRKVLVKSECLQKRIINETLQAVASAMHKLGMYYVENGKGQLGKIYLETAGLLNREQSPSALNKAWSVHLEYKNNQLKKSTLKGLLKKVERRLKRASEEAKPLGQTLKLEARCVVHEWIQDNR